MAVEVSTKQMALLLDGGPGGFMERVQAMMAKVAVDILSEPGTTAYHSQRASYAQRVLASPATAMNQAGTMVVMSTNVIAFTVYDEATKKSTCPIPDLDLQSQIMNLWNALAGIDTPS